MKTFISLIIALLALQSLVCAETLTSNFSGSLTINGTNNHDMVFTKSGVLTIRFTTTSSNGVIVAMFLHNGTSVANKTASTQTTITFDPIQVWAGDTYTLRMYCPYGSNGYAATLSLICDTNSPPVITSMTASPDSADYGSPISVSVVATDPDNNLSYIQLVNYSVSNASPLSYVFNNLPVGTYTVTANAFDTQAASSARSTSFSFARRPITVRAISGRSVYGTTPVNQGLQLVSGTLVNGETFSSLGFSVSQQITSTTAVGTYSIIVQGDPANYSVCRVVGTWSVVAASAGGIIDADGDGIDDRLESTLYGGTGNGYSNFFGDGDGDGYLNCLDTSAVYSDSNSLASRVPGGGGGPLILLPDRGIYEITTSTLVLSSR